MIDWTAAERRQRQQDEVWQGFTSSPVTHCAGWRQSVDSVPRQRDGPLGCQPPLRQNRRSSLLRPPTPSLAERPQNAFIPHPASSQMAAGFLLHFPPVLNLFLRRWKAEGPNSQQCCAEDVLDELRGNALQTQSPVSVQMKPSTTSGSVSRLRAPVAAAPMVGTSAFRCLPLERAVQMTGGEPAGLVNFDQLSNMAEKLAFNVKALFCCFSASTSHFHIFLFHNYYCYYFLRGNSAVHCLGADFFPPRDS